MSSLDPQLGDLVLAKFDVYPYWPAVVERCFWSERDFHNTWRIEAGQAVPEDEPGDDVHPRVWCRFIEDDSANWVPVTRVKKFTPATARRWQCRRRTKNYDRQQAAISVAEELFNKRLTEPHSSASTDAGGSDSGDPPFPETPSEEQAVVSGKRRYEEAEDSAPAEPSPPRKTARAGSADSVSERASTEQQSTTEQKAQPSPRKMRVRSEWADRYRLSVACARVSPPPARAGTRSPLTSDAFADIVRRVRGHVGDLRNALAGVYRGEVSNARVAAGEDRAAEAHEAIGALLVRLADADVPLDDLRHHKAGKLVTGIVKDLGLLHGIRPAGDEIIARWRRMCEAFDGAAGQEVGKPAPVAAAGLSVEGGSV